MFLCLLLNDFILLASCEIAVKHSDHITLQKYGLLRAVASCDELGSTFQPHCNTIFGVHRSRPCHITKTCPCNKQIFF